MIYVGLTYVRLIFKNGTKTSAIANFYSSKHYRGKELKTCQERPYLHSGRFIEVFYKTTTFEWFQERSSYTGLTAFLVKSTHNIFTLSGNAFKTFNSCFATCFFFFFDKFFGPIIFITL